LDSSSFMNLIHVFWFGEFGVADRIAICPVFVSCLARYCTCERPIASALA
jgi:hypothetical protein